jgi:peptidoglycan hydrolase-like protein with peptidoglycan-binding domain
MADEPLAEGAQGDAVKALQTALNAKGATLAVDGVFGPHTAKAVKNFQTDNALHVDGVVGPETEKALHA